MYIEQLYTGCLAEAAYYIESEGEAAIIDPLRETEPYLKLAAARGTKIKYVLETHFHADFVSGHLDLARETGAKIIYGPGAQANFDFHAAQDGEELPLGNIKLKVLHTPGHTLESSCYLVIDAYSQPVAVFTGDTLFVNEVGRPDLAVKSDLTVEDLAGLLYDSLRNKLMTLPPEVVVYPAHGAGSACGRNIGKETYSTIGQQLQNNYALQPMTKAEFIATITEGLPKPPAYFFKDAAINRDGYTNIDHVLANNTVGLTLSAFEAQINNGALVLDCRVPDDFENGFIPGAVNIGLEGQYAPWVGALLNIDTPLVLVTEPGKEKEAVLRLARIGYENVKGYLHGGFETWKNAGKSYQIIESISADVFAARLSEAQPLDVRRPGEWAGGIVPGALTLALDNLPDQIHTLDKSKPYFVYCGGGYRSMIAASLLKKAGFQHVINIKGGWSAIKNTPIGSLVLG